MLIVSILRKSILWCGEGRGNTNKSEVRSPKFEVEKKFGVFDFELRTYSQNQRTSVEVTVRSRSSSTRIRKLKRRSRNATAVVPSGRCSTLAVP